MRAMRLAAGFATRLLPHTEQTPKPLFTIAGRPILDRMIENLIKAGAEAIIINTHHLSEQIEKHFETRDYGIPVEVCREPEILGTGGALKNVAYFWDDKPFLVANSDIVTDIDFETVYQFHLDHQDPVTLVLCDDPEFNQVAVDSQGRILDFQPVDAVARTWTFTGIHVIDPVVLDLVPDGCFANIIDTYRDVMQQGQNIRAFTVSGVSWDDVGTPRRYTHVARRETGRASFKKAFPASTDTLIDIQPLQGDGSDRNWFRCSVNDTTTIMVDHGIKHGTKVSEADAFVNIGRHLYKKDVAVPRIWFSDTFAGIVCLQDMGNLHLQDFVRNAGSKTDIIDIYRKVIRELVHMSIAGFEGFDPEWAWQTKTYDKALILEKECRYFIEAFLNGYLNFDTAYEDLEDEFVQLADGALNYAFIGFMHRDLQSRNIMIKKGSPCFIDYQGGRTGPLQYDIASLLIDPYVALDQALQDALFKFCVTELSKKHIVDPVRFQKGYMYCIITRNLQALGAFGYLTKNRGKPWFETYIPAAIKTLQANLLRYFPNDDFLNLKNVVKEACLAI